MPTSRTLQAWCPRCGGRIHEHTADWRCARCDFKLPAFRDGQRRDIEDIEREVQNILDEIAAAKGAPAEKPQPAPADPLVDSRHFPRYTSPDIPAATQANDLALQYAHYPDLRKRLLADQKLFRRPGT